MVGGKLRGDGVGVANVKDAGVRGLPWQQRGVI